MFRLHLPANNRSAQRECTRTYNAILDFVRRRSGGECSYGSTNPDGPESRTRFGPGRGSRDAVGECRREAGQNVPRFCSLASRRKPGGLPLRCAVPASRKPWVAVHCHPYDVYVVPWQTRSSHATSPVFHAPKQVRDPGPYETRPARSCGVFAPTRAHNSLYHEDDSWRHRRRAACGV